MRDLAGILLFVVAKNACAQLCAIPGDAVFGADFERSSGRVYYIAPSGDDAHDGSASAPWHTLQHAVDQSTAGDALCARAGVYNEIVSVSHGGSAAAGAIVLRNVPGEPAIVDGTGLAVPNGQWGLITLQNPSHVVVRGLELRNFTTSSTSKVPIGLYITGAGTDIRVLDNHIHDIGTSASGCAANAFGLKVDGTQAPASINDLVIDGNEIDHLVLGCSESFSLDGNVEQWTILNNRVHDTNNIAIGAIGFEGVAPDPAHDQARDGTIRGNTVYNISSFGNPAYGNEYAADGIYVDGGTRILIERNRVHHVDIGIELASEHAGRVTSDIIVRDNLVYFGNSAGVSIGGYSADVGGTDRCTIVNNTLFHNDRQSTGSGEVQIQYHASANLIANNLIESTSAGILLSAATADTPAPATLDHNLYFVANGGSSTWTWLGIDYGTLADYRAASSQDLHSSVADPQLADSTTPDLHVASTSAAIDAGGNLGGAVIGSLDFDGRPRIAGAGVDIGAYER